MTTPVGNPVGNTTGTPAPAPASNTSALTSDFETFLKMLTAQARNQDPLEPLDSSEYAAQLAQFSMVEQQVQTNNMLANLVNQLGASDMTALAGWVGMDVRARAPAHFSGTPVTVSPTPRNTADKAYLNVRDSSGTVVERYEIPVSQQPITWAGTDDAGVSYPSGLYTFSVESHKDGTMIADDPVATYNRVIEAQIQDGGIVLTLAGGQVIQSSVVTAVRAGS